MIYFAHFKKVPYLCVKEGVMKKRAIIYARVSSASERQETERQIIDLSNCAEANNIEIVHVFSEKISGVKKNYERKVFSEAMDFAKAENIDVILVSEFSRLGRSTWETLEAVKRCIDNHIDVFFQKENLHIFDEGGNVNSIMAVYISCLGVCAEKERENIVFRLSSGRRLAISKGMKMGRKVGSTKSKEQKKAQYAIALKYLKKGMSVANVLRCCHADGIKISERTIWNLKKEFMS